MIKEDGNPLGKLLRLIATVSIIYMIKTRFAENINDFAVSHSTVSILARDRGTTSRLHSVLE